MDGPSIDTVVEDVLRLFEYGHITDPALIEEYGKGLQQSLTDSLQQQLDGRDFRLRLSAIGRPSRQLYYQKVDAPHQPIPSKTLFMFQYGHILEELFLTLAEEAGHIVEGKQREIIFEDIPGHIDAVIDGVLIDVKSASAYGYSKFLNGTIRDNDSFGYIAQLSAYYQGGGFTKGAAFIAISKVTGDICLCKFSHEEMMAVDVSSHARRNKRVRDSNDLRVPARCYEDRPLGKSGNRELASPCGWCSFKYHCWRDANNGQGLKTYIYSAGPKYLTNVSKEPRVFDVEPPKLITRKERDNA